MKTTEGSQDTRQNVLADVQNDSDTIQAELARRFHTQGSEGDLARSLSELASWIVPQAEAHLKQIIAQHPGFDLHDETHAATVLQNIASLIGPNELKARSVFELFMLWMAAYLHDCAMALPQWELNLFQLTEGISKDGDKLGVHNDLKPTIAYDAAVSLIRTHAEELYGSYAAARTWPFSPRTESAFVSDLAARLRAYQDFRGGNASALRDASNNADRFAECSLELRQTFIRETHWTRIESWIRNLDEVFEERLAGRWGRALAHDLARVCRSHGEDREYIKGLPRTASYFGPSQSDLQLAAALLRLGDIIHFSADRAPLILYREKLIASPMSRKHWEVKNEGINYSIVNSPAGERIVRYSAYFQVPSLYFLFQEYVDWVDREFALYNEIISRPDGKRPDNTSIPLLGLRADRSGVRYDPAKFEPVAGLRFSLNQRRILDLLMGVNLYQDRFACLRELYQNALDACRCMLSIEQGAAVDGQIEFGLCAAESGEKYLFCRDNGIGMTKDIVTRFFLQIGNSFYRSSEFQRLATNLGSTFTPTSQFGIGILSCFMIGHRMEIVSQPINSLDGATAPISFVIDGPHEHFYYSPVDPADAEAVGRHGTLVKVFLKNDAQDEVHVGLEDVAFFEHAAASLKHDTPFSSQAKRWESHLYHRVSSFVAQPAPGIAVNVRLSDDQSVAVLRATMPFDYKALGVDRDKIAILDAAQSKYRFADREFAYLDIIDAVVPKEIVVEEDGTEFSCVVSWPKRGFPYSDCRALREVRALSKDSGVLIDGITIGKSEVDYTLRRAETLSGAGIMNFTGRVRPVLSVNRMSVVEWPRNIEELTATLTHRLTIRLLDEVETHANNEGLSPGSDELALIWEYLFSRFAFLAGDLINTIVSRAEANVQHRELSRVVGQAISIKDFALAPTVQLRTGDFHALTQTTKLLLVAKLTDATQIVVIDDTIMIAAGSFAPLRNYYDWDHFRERQYVFRADTWSGRYEEFDILPSVWPVIPTPLFEKLGSHHGDTKFLNARTKLLHCYANSLSAVSKFDPLLIHHRLGIYEAKHRSFLEQKPASFVYRFEEARNNFWFGELDPDVKSASSKRVSYFITAFVPPRPLNPDEQAALERYRVEDPEYCRGVESGWSILFTGQRDLNVVCVPGEASKQKLLAAIPETFWSARNREDFTFLT